MGYDRGVQPIRLPSRKTKTLPGNALSAGLVEGPALATNEDDGLLILTDDTALDIILENYT